MDAYAPTFPVARVVWLRMNFSSSQTSVYPPDVVIRYAVQAGVEAPDDASAEGSTSTPGAITGAPTSGQPLK